MMGAAVWMPARVSSQHTLHHSSQACSRGAPLFFKEACDA